MSAPLSREDALEALAQRLYFHVNYLDPIGESEWDHADEAVRSLYRCAIERLIQRDRHLLEAALAQG
jgi:hypothetical protein